MHFIFSLYIMTVYLLSNLWLSYAADLLMRTDAARDRMDGFFVALFVRKSSISSSIQPSDELEALDTEGTIIEQDAKTSLQRRRKLKRQRKKEQQAFDAKVN